MWRIHRLAILPALALLIGAMTAVSIPLANADTSPDPGMHSCALGQNGQQGYPVVSAECGNKGRSAAPSHHKRPVLAGIESAALRYAAGAKPVRVTTSLTVTSPAGVVTGATVRVSSGFAPGLDFLGLAGQSRITGHYDPGDGALTLTGTASPAAYRAALRSVTYRYFGAAGGTRTISFQAIGAGRSLSNTVSRAVRIAPAPVPPAPGPPTVASPSYDAVGNTPLGVGTTPPGPAATVSGSVLDGDTDPDPRATLSVTGSAQPAHGTVTVNPDGAFTYLPDPGYSGADSFTVTIAGSDHPGLTATETVTITVGTLVWYADDSGDAAGNGTAGSPFSTLAGADAAAGADSIVFLYSGDGDYTGGAVMQPGEDLWGQPHGLTVSGYPLVPAGGSNPVITNSGGDGIDLAEGADVEGVSVTGPSGNGIAANTVNDAAVGATSPVTASGAGGAGILADGGDGTLNFGATSVTGSAGDAVDVSNRGGGTVTFGGPISGTGGGVYLDGNTSATIAFTGTLTLDTMQSDAFYSSGGTVTATGAGSTLSSHIDNPLSDNLHIGSALFLGSGIGAAGMTFQSVSCFVPGAGIFVDGGPGRLIITGTGAPGSGGTITGWPGIQLYGAYEPSFTDMTIDGPDSDGIAGGGVDGLTLDDSGVGSSVQPSVGGAYGGTGLAISDLSGSASIAGSSFGAQLGAAADITDTTGTLSLTVTGTTFGGGDAPGLVVAADDGADATVSVTGSTFSDDVGGSFLFSANSASEGADSVTFTNNTVNGDALPGPPAGGVAITADGTATVCAAITGNSISGLRPGDPGIEADQGGTTTIDLPGYTGGPADTSAVESFLTGGNDISGTPAVIATVSGSGGGFTGGPGC
jgi:hypothetical protein